MGTSPELVEVSECPVCGSETSSHFESILELERTINYQLCGNCGTVYQSPRMTDSALASYYQTDYVSQHQHAIGVTQKELRIQAGRARNLAQILSSQITRVERHLDIGSSTGSLMLAIKHKYGNEVIGIEPAKVYRAYCEARGLTVMPDLDSIDDGRFDLITMAHVAEHLPDPVGYLRKVRHERLTDDGTLLVEVPNLYGHRSIEIPHLICFSPQTLRFALESAGYKVVRMSRHGAPRSRLIPLYLTAVARPVEGLRATKPGPSMVRSKRGIGMAWNRIASRLAPGWAWLPLPDLEEDQE